MKDPLSFDHRPDLVLGKALREALDPGDAPVFIARVLAHAEHVRVASWDAVLARWARTGVAAALVMALAAGYFVGRATATSPRPTVSDVLIAPPAHRDSVRAIVQRHRTRMTAVWETVRPRFDSMRAQMDSEVALQLTPDQQAKYRDHVVRYRHQKDQEQADTGSGGRKGRRK